MPRSTPGNYVPLDVNYASDAAIRRAGEAAEILFVRGLAYAKGHKTGGFIPDYDLEVVAAGLRRLAPRVAALVEYNLWLPVDGGWQVRSWGPWNSAGEAVSEAGKLAAHHRHHVKGKKRSDDCEHCDPPPPKDATVHAIGNTTASGSQSDRLCKGREVVVVSSPVQSSSVTRATDDDLDRIIDLLAGLRPRRLIDREWAARVHADITYRTPADVRDRAAYMAECIRNEPDRYLPTPTPAPFKPAPNPTGAPASDVSAKAAAAKRAVADAARAARYDAAEGATA